MYPLSEELAAFLLSEPAQQALAELSRADLAEGKEITILSTLRKRFSPSEAAALLDQARLRKRAENKFPDAGQLFFTDEALEQASSAVVAHYHAQRFRSYHRVADLGCGIGGDTLALAEVVPEVLAIEKDIVRARLAAANVAARRPSGYVQVICADWTKLPLPVDAAFADPDRRINGRRLFHLDQVQPPITAFLELLARVPNLALKAPPGIREGEIPDEAEIEFVSERGTLKEALLLFGALRSGNKRIATILPGPHHLVGTDSEASAGLGEPATYLYEPDPAVLRARLVRTLATTIGAWQIDPEIAYLTSDMLRQTPFARVWHILRHGPFHLKTLNRWLREEQVGTVIVKKRGSPIEPEELRKRLKTAPTGATLTVFLTRVSDRPWMILCEPAETPKRTCRVPPPARTVSSKQHHPCEFTQGNGSADDKWATLHYQDPLN